MAGALVMALAALAGVGVGVSEEALAGISIGVDISLGGEEVMRQDITCLIP